MDKNKPARIIIDDDWYIVLHTSGTFDLVNITRTEVKDKKTKKPTGEIKLGTAEHGYHSNLESAVYRYAQETLIKSGKDYTISEYMQTYYNKIDETMDRVKRGKANGLHTKGQN